MLTRRDLLWTSAGVLLWGCSTPEAAEEPTAEAPEAAPEPAEPEHFNSDDLAARLEAGEDIYLLDVRTPEELEEHGMIEGAVNIPIDDLEARLAEVPKDRPVAVY